MKPGLRAADILRAEALAGSAPDAIPAVDGCFVVHGPAWWADVLVDGEPVFKGAEGER